MSCTSGAGNDTTAPDEGWQDPENIPFPLTELQQAYWIGEQDVYLLSTPAYVYRSFSASEIDHVRLNAALLHMVRTHPALRTSILPNGTQKFVAPPVHLDIPFTDWSDRPEEEQRRLLASRREQIASSLPSLESGQKFACLVDKVTSGYFIHFLFRLISMDGRSIVLFLRELASVYLGDAVGRVADVTYRDYVERRTALKGTRLYRRSLHYWNSRRGELPNAPRLPIVDYDAVPTRSEFERRQLRLRSDEIARLDRKARDCGVTVNSVLCAAFVDILRRWSSSKRFTLNVLTSLRPPEPEFAGVIGNFTSTLLLETTAEGKSFRERAIALQKRLYRDLIKHSQVSGIDVIRATYHTGNKLPVMPVVFASMLGTDREQRGIPYSSLGWRRAEGGMQTPQVWLDHQVYMDEGEMVLNWDSVKDVFAPGVIEQMFLVYEAHLGNILREETNVDDPLLPVLPEIMLRARDEANDTARTVGKELLHEQIERAQRHYPDKTAVVAPDRALSYRCLWRLSTGLAVRLRDAGVGRNDLVAILARRGWRQVTAALAVVQSGGAYLPVSSDLPVIRKNYLIAQKGVKVLLVEDGFLDDLAVAENITVLSLNDVLSDDEPDAVEPLVSVQKPEDLAYVIFTSGSTGQPKGVAIDHRGAANTIQDVLDRFQITSADRVIGVSAFNFDLSVFDIFGTWAVGATLVIPPHRTNPSPEDWADVVREQRVTVWNSVPALLEMVIEYCAERAVIDLSSLRLVLLSGDWIPLSLPGRLFELVPGVTVVGLGGATEASIWSNYFVIEEVNPSWKSIPYGWPLSNQLFRVLDEDLQPSPTWVPGQLYIGGIGLAKGYYEDPERTAKQFITHPQTGERLYKTGDIARYHPNGCLEFLGREDSQVKIRGFRIELGEIEAALERSPGIRGASVVVEATSQGDQRLVCVYACDIATANEVAAAARRHLETLLPGYMVPSRFIPVSTLPVTANGKVDREAVKNIAGEWKEEKQSVMAPPRDALERQLMAQWSELLGIPLLGIDEDFFELGGTSLLAVRLLNAIENEFAKRIPLASLFSHSTIASQAQLLRDCPSDQKQETARVPIVTIKHGGRVRLLAVHPVGGNILCYRSLVNLAPQSVSVLGVQSPGTGQPRRLTRLAGDYAAALGKEIDKADAIHLFGWSMGGVVAHALAGILEKSGYRVTSVTMVDSWIGDDSVSRTITDYALLKNFVVDFLDGADESGVLEDIAHVPAEQQMEGAARMLRRKGILQSDVSDQQFMRLLAEYAANYRALIDYRAESVDVGVHLYRAGRVLDRFPCLVPFQPKVRGDNTEEKHTVVELEEDHFSIIRGGSLERILATVPW